MILALLLGCAPNAAQAYQTALDGSRSVGESVSLCALTGDQAEACTTSVMRSRSDVVASDCEQIAAEKWRSECYFSVAERHGFAKERWAALQTCGRAGAFYAECLFHVWTYELQATLLPDVHPNRQVMRPVATIRFWGSIQTVGGLPAEQLWIDWWYLGMKGRMARLADCEPLGSTDERRCVVGMTAYVARSVADFLQNPQADSRAKDRVCRGGAADVQAVFPNLYEEDSTFGEAVTMARDLACGVSAAEMQRPWNPIFLEWRAWAAG